MTKLIMIKEYLEQNPSERDILDSSHSQVEKAIALYLSGSKDLANDIVNEHLDQDELNTELLSNIGTDVQSLFMRATIDTVMFLFKNQHQAEAKSLVKELKAKNDVTEYNQNFSEYFQIKEISGEIVLKLARFEANEKIAQLLNLFEIEPSLSSADDGVAYLLENLDKYKDSPNPEATATFRDGEFLVSLNTDIDLNPSIQKIAKKSLGAMLERIKDSILDPETRARVESTIMGGTVTICLVAAGLSYVDTMKKINDGSMSQNVKSMVLAQSQLQK